MKLKRKYSQRRITDIDYNRLVDLITGFNQLTAKRLRVFSENPSDLMTLIRNNFSGQFKKIEIAREGGSKPFVRIFFNSKDDRIRLENKLRKMESDGKIISYDKNNTNSVTTENGSRITLTGTPGLDRSDSEKNNDIIPVNNNQGGTGELSTGISTTTIIIVAIIAIIGLYVIFKK